MRSSWTSIARCFFCLLLLGPIGTWAQVAKLLETCSSSIKCDSGLYCIELRSSKMVCSKCTESDNRSMSRDVDDACKTFGEGWAFESNRTYTDSTASDGRINNAVFDVLFEQAKKCREARQRRESTCWGGGDEEHKRALSRIDSSMENIRDHRAKMAQNKRLFYTDKSTYQNRFDTYRDKCERLEFNNLRQTLDAGRVAFDRGDKVDCTAIEQVGTRVMECFQAAKSLSEDGFRSRDRVPEQISRAFDQSGPMFNEASARRSSARDKNLCR